MGRLGMICNDGNNPGLQIIFTDFRNCTCVLQPATWFAIKTLSVRVSSDVFHTDSPYVEGRRQVIAD